MAVKKTGLGRGLNSLFDDTTLITTPAPIEKPKDKKPEKTEKANSAKPEKSSSAKVEKKVSSPVKEEKIVKEEKPVVDAVNYIKVSDIKPNSAQPRKTFNEEALQELADSIKENGLIQPIVVRPAKKGFELVAGERRWRAARIAGLKEIPAIVRDIDEKTNALYALIENIQREDLNAVEAAEGIQSIMKSYGFTQEETAKVVGKSRTYVTNSLRLLDLPGEVIELVRNGALSMGHAKALAALATEDIQIEVARKAAQGAWSVRQIEGFTKAKPKKKPSTSKKPAKKDAETIELEERLAEALGTKVSIIGSPKRGVIEVSYFSQDELDRIISALEG